MLAAAARAGAPLGHDFCVINLSDNLKPWAVIEKRLKLAAEADFAMAFYNPRSKHAPRDLKKHFRFLIEAAEMIGLLFLLVRCSLRRNRSGLCRCQRQQRIWRICALWFLLAPAKLVSCLIKTRLLFTPPEPIKAEPTSPELVQVDPFLPVQAAQAGLS